MPSIITRHTDTLWPLHQEVIKTVMTAINLGAWTTTTTMWPACLSVREMISPICRQCSRVCAHACGFCLVVQCAYNYTQSHSHLTVMCPHICSTCLYKLSTCWYKLVVPAQNLQLYRTHTYYETQTMLSRVLLIPVPNGSLWSDLSRLTCT